MSRRDTRQLLAVFAHPDDESFGPGGTLARYADRGVEVWLLCATRGERARHRGGHEGDQALAATRESELRAACQVLGITHLEILGYADRGMRPDDASGIERVREAMERARPDVTLTFGPGGISGHPDHIAVLEWTRAAWERLGRPGRLYGTAIPESVARRFREATGRDLLATPEDRIAARIDVGPWVPAKVAAIRCHQTQRYPIDLSDVSRIGRLATEHFVELGTDDVPRPPRMELFVE